MLNNQRIKVEKVDGSVQDKRFLSNSKLSKKNTNIKIISLRYSIIVSSGGSHQTCSVHYCMTCLTAFMTYSRRDVTPLQVTQNK